MYRAKYRAGPAGPSKVLSLKNGRETPCTSSVPDSPGGRYYGVPFYPRIRKWRIIPLKGPFFVHRRNSEEGQSFTDSRYITEGNPIPPFRNRPAYAAVRRPQGSR